MTIEKQMYFLVTLVTISIFVIAMLDIISLKPYFLESSATIVYFDSMVYETQEALKEVTFIQWGSLSPSENKTLTYYVRSNLKTSGVLTVTTSKWQPSDANDYISFEVTPENEMFNPQQIKPLNFTLRISPAIQNITNFSFQITLNMV